MARGAGGVWGLRWNQPDPQGWRWRGQDACTPVGHQTRVREARTRGVSGSVRVRPFPGPQLSSLDFFAPGRAGGSQVRGEEGGKPRAEKW